MTPDTPRSGRALLVCSAALLIGLGLSGCGRRGPLESPPDAAAAAGPARAASPADSRLRPARSAAGQAAPPSTALATRSAAGVQDTPDNDEEELDVMQSVVPTPNPTPRRRSRPFAVPTDSFILDPLL